MTNRREEGPPNYRLLASPMPDATPAIIADATSHAINGELVVQLTPAMQAIVATLGTPV